MKPRTISTLLVFFHLLAIHVGSWAQDQTALQYAATISEISLRENLSILASDALEGRETGKRGQKMAAAFIRSYFEDLGLAGPVDGSYYQPVSLYTSKSKSIYLSVNGQRFNDPGEIVFYGSKPTKGEEAISLVYAGLGRAGDFGNLNIEGKGVVIFVNDLENFRQPVALAREKKAAAIFLFGEDQKGFMDLMGQYRGQMNNGVMSLVKPDVGLKANVFFMESAVAPAMFKTTFENLKKAAVSEVKKKAIQKIKPVTIQYNVDTQVTTLKTENVLGYLEGTDKKDELVVVTAHYDHIGVKTTGDGDRVNNGADDDGSGTVAVLEIAKAFAQAKKDGKGPRRSILFMTVTGEEKGLLGSEWYTQQPVFPLASTVVNLNLDMLGRRDPEHNDSDPYVYLIGADKLSSELHRLSEQTNLSTTKLKLEYLYNDEAHPMQLYYRSDHWNFAKKNIPVIFYFDGIHEDYHKPSDEISKIEFDLLKQRTLLVFYTAWEIANRERRLELDPGKAK
jgi:hypothetical protein